jgi:hypothetical protein
VNTVQLLSDEFKELFTESKITEMICFIQHRTLIGSNGLNDAVRLACNTSKPFIKQLAATQAELTAVQAQLATTQSELATAQAALAAAQATNN